jgi:hypothetical protein
LASIGRMGGFTGRFMPHHVIPRRPGIGPGDSTPRDRYELNFSERVRLNPGNRNIEKDAHRRIDCRRDL